MKLLLLVVLVAGCVIQNGSAGKEEAEKAAKGFEDSIDKLSEFIAKINKALEDGAKGAGEKLSEQLDKAFNPVFDKIAENSGPQNKDCVDAQKKDAQEKRKERFQNGLLCIAKVVTGITDKLKDIVDAVSADEKAVKAVGEASAECPSQPPQKLANCFAEKIADPAKEGSDATSKAILAVKDLGTIQLKLPNQLVDCVSEQVIGGEQDSVGILLELTKCTK